MKTADAPSAAASAIAPASTPIFTATPPPAETPAADVAPTPEQIEAQRLATEAAERSRIEAANKKKRERLDGHCADIAKRAALGRAKVKELRDHATAIEVDVVNLEGAVITARDVARHDLDRAGAGLARALDAVLNK